MDCKLGRSRCGLGRQFLGITYVVVVLGLLTACAPLKYNRWYTKGVGSAVPNDVRFGTLARINSSSDAEKLAMVPNLKQLYALGDAQDKYWALEAASIIGVAAASVIQGAVGDQTPCQRFVPSSYAPAMVSADGSGRIRVEGQETLSTLDREARRLLGDLKAQLAEEAKKKKLQEQAAKDQQLQDQQRAASLKSGIFTFAQITFGLKDYFTYAATTPVDGHQRVKGIRSDGMAVMFVTGTRGNIIGAELSMQAPPVENGDGNTWQYKLILQLMQNAGVTQYAAEINNRLMGTPYTPREWNFDTQFWHIYVGWMPGQALVLSIKKL
jgi:hypothetical protein